MKRCANETCSSTAARKFCSRECQLAARNEGALGRHKRKLPDLWIGMDLYRALEVVADEQNMTVADVALNAIEAAADYTPLELFPESA